MQGRNIWPTEWVNVVSAVEIHCYRQSIMRLPVPFTRHSSKTGLRAEIGSGLLQRASIYFRQLRIGGAKSAHNHNFEIGNEGWSPNVGMTTE
jgi:hypothetical protein